MDAVQLDDTFELVPETVRVRKPKPPIDTYAVARLKTEEGVRHVCRLAGVDEDKGAFAWLEARKLPDKRSANNVPQADYVAMAEFLDATGLFR